MPIMQLRTACPRACPSARSRAYESAAITSLRRRSAFRGMRPASVGAASAASTRSRESARDGDQLGPAVVAVVVDHVRRIGLARLVGDVGEGHYPAPGDVRD